LTPTASSCGNKPIVPISHGESDRREILLRMLGDDGEPIPPGVFLYIAEHFGQIQAIDRGVIDRSIRLLAERKAAGVDAHLEVNLSGASITDADTPLPQPTLQPRADFLEAPRRMSAPRDNVNLERLQSWARAGPGQSRSVSLDACLAWLTAGYLAA
jgi:hypothetical protein